MACLPFPEPGTVSIGSSNYSFDVRDGRCVYFANFDPISSHGLEETGKRNRMIGWLAYEGRGVRLVDLAKAFGVNPKTVERLRDQFRDSGPESFTRPRKPRGPSRKELPYKAEAERLLAAGMSRVRVAEKLGIHVSTLHLNIRKGRISAKRLRSATEGSEAPEAAAPTPVERGERDHRDRKAPMGRGARDVKERVQASRGEISERKPEFKENCLAVRGSAVLAALGPLMKEGLLAPALEHLYLSDCYYGVQTMMLYNAFFLLRRLAPSEAVRQPPGEWGPPLGMDRGPCDKTYYSKMDELSEEEERLDALAMALTKLWAEDVPDGDAILLADMHYYPYSGDEGILPKNWVSSMKMSLPSIAALYLNFLGGMPLGCIYKKLNRGMRRAIERDMVPRMKKAGLIGPDAPDLSAVWAEALAALKAERLAKSSADATEKEKAEAEKALAAAVERARAAARNVKAAMTLVFDREGWSPALFRRLEAEGVAVITWHKGFAGEDWPEEEFKWIEVPDYGPFGIEGETEYRIAERTIPLTIKSGKNAQVIWVRQIRRLMPDGRQVAFVTNNFSVSLERVAGAMFSRWSQENFFKYMKREFGLGKMSSYDLVDLDPETSVVNPRWREMKREYERLRGRLRRRRDRAGNLEQSVAAGKNRDASRKLEQVRSDIRELETEIETLQIRRKGVPQRILAGQLSEEEKLQAIEMKRNLLLDLIRMICFRAETKMTAPLGGGREGRRPRKILRDLFQSEADIIPEPENGVLRVRVLGGFRDSAEASLAVLFEELNQAETIYPETNLRMVFELPEREDAPVLERPTETVL